MIIPVGTRVRVIDEKERFTVSKEGTITGFEDNPPSSISRHYVTLDGDITFKYPKLFSWQVKVIR